MSRTLSYLKEKYPSGRLKASYRQLEEVEKLNREECLQLRQHRKDGYVDIQYLADLLNQI